MKSKVFNKVFSLIMLGVMFTLPLPVHAVESSNPSDFNDSKTVTVGNVETPVYSVDVAWGSLAYDWKYNKDMNEFEFKASLGCEGYVMSSGDTTLQSYKEQEILYSDNKCTTKQTSNLVNGTTYYLKSGVGGEISVIDNSTNGKVKAAVQFTPSQKYNWVSGKFFGSYSFGLATEDIDYFDEITNGYLPEVQGGLSIRKLRGWLKLDVDSNYTDAKTVKSGETIGTVTVAIIQDTN